MKQTIRKILVSMNLELSHIFPRSSIRFIGNNLQGELIGAEIGVYKGKNAESILKTLDIEKLYLIDPYELYEGYDEGKEQYGKIQDSLEEAEQIASEKLNKYVSQTKAIIIKKYSSDALKDIPDNLDFVYIDGNHHYEFVKKDIENYWKKIKIGGILAGHDFNYDNTTEVVTEVHLDIIKAVTEFAVHNNLKLYSAGNVYSSDWWIIKSLSLGEE